jgi:tRNA (guanine-N7-)-methyltransferase
MARMFPGKNFIGIDIKGSRLFHPAREISEEGMANAALLRCKIDFIDQIFAAEVNEIWVTFPDPFIEKPRRRLTSPFFLSRYHKVLRPGGIINLKTDNTEVYSSTLALAQENGLPILKATDDLYSGAVTKVESIKTTYERKFLEAGKKICLLRFVLDRQIDSTK